jgi:hypothetical protein
MVLLWPLPSLVITSFVLGISGVSSNPYESNTVKGAGIEKPGPEVRIEC